MVIRKTRLRIVSTVLMAVNIRKAWPEIPPVAAMAGDVPNSKARKADGSIIVRAPLRWISVAWWKPRSRSCCSDKWSRVVVSVVDRSAHGLRHKCGGLGNLDAQIFPVLLQQLPLQEDFEENDSVFHCICYLCGIGHEVFMKNLPAILRIVLKVIQTDQITIETRVNLLHLVKSLSLSYPQEIQAILQECSLEEQQVFQAVWKNS
ncbi:hypothetical protein HPB51_029344 [Rhipicephalus microplus]|uniref:Uncharacterized protein n=1 Tax=Rhipicephalus microplus TaxID=6941 RepID=A0A9J6CUU9_RHIMP|nr:hypothetical protein HPB51_029344 [Rhipicephalus microplus]